MKYGFQKLKLNVTENKLKVSLQEIKSFVLIDCIEDSLQKSVQWISEYFSTLDWVMNA